MCLLDVVFSVFLSQTDRQVSVRTCDFVESIVIDKVLSSEMSRQFMFSVYNVQQENSEISEKDMLGSAMCTQQDFIQAIVQQSPLQLPMIVNNAYVPNSFLIIQRAAFVSAPTKTTAEPVKLNVQITCNNLPSVNGSACTPLAALYMKDDSQGQYEYSGQTERFPNNCNPVFQTELSITYELTDRECMINVYNNAQADTAMSEQDLLGSALFTLNQLLTANNYTLTVALIHATSTLNATLTIKVVSQQQITSSNIQINNGNYNLSLSIKGLSVRAQQNSVNSMIALYAQDPSNASYTYVGQTERIVNDCNPVFSQGIVIPYDSQSSSMSQRALMFMIYDAINETEITENDQVGTCSVLLQDLLTASLNTTQTLPVMDKQGQIIPTTTIQIQATSL